MNVWTELMFVNKQIIILIITLTGFKSLLEKKNGKKKIIKKRILYKFSLLLPVNMYVHI